MVVTLPINQTDLSSTSTQHHRLWRMGQRIQQWKWYIIARTILVEVGAVPWIQPQTITMSVRPPWVNVQIDQYTQYTVFTGVGQGLAGRTNNFKTMKNDIWEKAVVVKLKISLYVYYCITDVLTGFLTNTYHTATPLVFNVHTLYTQHIFTAHQCQPHSIHIVTYIPGSLSGLHCLRE